MPDPKENLQMEKIVSLCKRRGFIFQSSEIYGGINGFWDYGPLGAELKRNVKELWWNAMTRQRDDVAGLEATIIMSPQIWKASGHVDTFAIRCVNCPADKKTFRADQVEPQSGTGYFFGGACETKKMKQGKSFSIRDLKTQIKLREDLLEPACVKLLIKDGSKVLIRCTQEIQTTLEGRTK
jgi:glycyl-tRNA synthetase